MRTISARGQVNCAIAISQLTSTEATIGVIAAGGVPYYTGRVAIDFLGKADPYIATLEPDLSGAVGWFGMYSVPGHNKYDLEYSIKRLQPTFVWDFKWGKQDLSKWAKEHYRDVNYEDRYLLHFLKHSDDVDWQSIENLE